MSHGDDVVHDLISD